jgi:hypothetical protein
MTNQNYLIIENNVVTNVVLWNGDVNVWAPPANSIQLIESTTPARIWNAIVVDDKITDWALTEVIGAGSINFTWNGSVLTTNQPNPNSEIN